nr:two-pore potassium channel 1-like [Ipomoea batatas]GMD88552.1 two-pore potassium channel 1-like [Ipomoea batatas]
MSNTDVKDPLLPGTVGSSLQSHLKKAFKRRKNHVSGSAPGEEVLHPEHNDVKTLHPPGSFAPNSLKFRHVFLFLAVYLGVGVVCFSVIRDQIEGKKTNGVLDAIYLCVVTMTTVGYGDLVPSSTLAKFLACVFAFAGMVLVGFVLSKAADSFLEKQEILFAKPWKTKSVLTPLCDAEMKELEEDLREGFRGKGEEDDGENGMRELG